MDQREHEYEPLGICHRLHNFIVRSLSAPAHKTVTLGRPMSQDMAKSQNGANFLCKSDQLVHPKGQAEAPSEGVEQCDEQGKELPTTKKDDASVRGRKGDTSVGDGKRTEEEVPSASVLPEAKAPKKTVSINEKVEKIYPSKKATRKKSRENSISFEQQEIDHEPKPLKSILKVGSDSGDRSTSFLNPSGG